MIVLVPIVVPCSSDDTWPLPMPASYEGSRSEGGCVSEGGGAKLRRAAVCGLRVAETAEGHLADFGETFVDCNARVLRCAAQLVPGHDV